MPNQSILLNKSFSLSVPFFLSLHLSLFPYFMTFVSEKCFGRKKITHTTFSQNYNLYSARKNYDEKPQTVIALHYTEHIFCKMLNYVMNEHVNTVFVGCLVGWPSRLKKSIKRMMIHELKPNKSYHIPCGIIYSFSLFRSLSLWLPLFFCFSVFP